MRFALPLLAAGLLVAAAVQAAAPSEDQVPVDRLRVTLEPIDGKPIGLARRISALFQELRARTVGVLRPRPGSRYRVTAVAYSSTVSQTDLSPCFTATGARVQRGIIATNFLPLGTMLRLGLGDQSETFIVLDRMNARYNGVPIIDIWHPTRHEALTFGRRSIEIEILGYIPRDQFKSRPVSELLQQPGKVEQPPGKASQRVPERGPLAALRRLLAFLPVRVIVPQERECLII